jgi:hypothetical protein
MITAQQVGSPSHDEPIEALPVVVPPVVNHYLSNTEELAELVETRNALAPCVTANSCVTCQPVL